MAKTKEEKFESLKRIGMEINTEFEISDQAKKIIENIDGFNDEHFKAWYKKHFGLIHGGHLHQYLQSPDGIMEAKRGN